MFKESSLLTKRILLISIIIVAIALVISLKLKVIKGANNELSNNEILRVKDKEYCLTYGTGALQIHTLHNKTLTYSIKVMNNERIVSYCISDLNNDLTDEILMIIGDKDSMYGREFVVYSFDDGLKKIYYKSFENMNPWKVQTSDVDGDGKLEISIAMYKKTKFHPVMAKRPYIYFWVDSSLFPMWRGSRLSKPFDDFIFQDIDADGCDELIAIELLSNGNKVINSYKWKGFGFESLIESNEYKDIYTIEKSLSFKDEIRIYILENSVSKWIALIYKDTCFVEGAR